MSAEQQERERGFADELRHRWESDPALAAIRRLDPGLPKRLAIEAGALASALLRRTPEAQQEQRIEE